MEGTNNGTGGDVNQELHNYAPLQLMSPSNTENQNQVAPYQGLGVGTNMMDPKKLKRVAACREYSQRYRLKQLHHIAHLESEVRALQAECASTFQKIKYVDTQNSLLRAQNGSMKQKVYAKAGELAPKEVKNLELKKERDRLKQLSLMKQSPYAESFQPKLTYNYRGMLNIASDQPGIFTQFMEAGGAPNMSNQPT